MTIKEVCKNLLSPVKNSLVYRKYGNDPLDEHLIYFESRNGKELAGNILRLIVAAWELYGDEYHFAVSAETGSRRAITKQLKKHGINDVKVCIYGSVEYLLCLQRAKYIINDVTFPVRFVKQEGQIYLNVWHGTPYKHMGLDSVYDCTHMHNIQRNLLMSDYLLFPSKYCEEKMMQAYSLEGIYRGEIIYEGYPRNNVFFEKKTGEPSEAVNRACRIYAYLPTYREYFNKEEAEYHGQQLKDILGEIDEQLTDNEILLLKLHNLEEAALNECFERWRHIRRFPTNAETYEVLKKTNCLVTDYSSVLYDYACSGKKIVLFPYDQEKYLENRGIYEQPVVFPFPVTRSVKDLIRELREEKKYNDEKFLKTYCSLEKADSAKNIMQFLLKHKETCIHKTCISKRPLLLTYWEGEKIEQPYSEPNFLRYFLIDFKIMKNKQEQLMNRPDCDGVIEVEGRLYPTIRDKFASLFWGESRTGITREVKRNFTGIYPTAIVLKGKNVTPEDFLKQLK